MSKILNARNMKTKPSKAKSFTGPARHISFLVSVEDAQAMLETIQGAVGYDSAIAIDLHIGKKQGRQGEEFMGGFFFVKDLSQPSEYGNKRRDSRQSASRGRTQQLAEKVIQDDDFGF